MLSKSRCLYSIIASSPCPGARPRWGLCLEQIVHAIEHILGDSMLPRKLIRKPGAVPHGWGAQWGGLDRVESCAIYTSLVFWSIYGILVCFSWQVVEHHLDHQRRIHGHIAGNCKVNWSIVRELQIGESLSLSYLLTTKKNEMDFPSVKKKNHSTPVFAVLWSDLTNWGTEEANIELKTSWKIWNNTSCGFNTLIERN